MTAVELGLPVAPAHLARGGRATGTPSAPARDLGARRSGASGMVHSWELVTAVDGPGTRMTVFLNGCPLRCQYCQNPDTWNERDGTLTTLDEIVERMRHYAPVFAATGGGLTLSGGEPLQQPAFVERIFTAARELGIHTALDTSGYLGAKASDALLDATSLVLLDVKSGLPETYRRTTTRELAPTVAFGRRLADRGIPMWIRFVMVPGLTDAPENVDAVAELVSGWETVERVEVLPFHQLGREKWHARGLEYTLEDVRSPENDAVEAVRDRFRARGLLTF